MLHSSYFSYILVPDDCIILDRLKRTVPQYTCTKAFQEPCSKDGFNDDCNTNLPWNMAVTA